MTAMNVVVQRDCVHLVTDGAAVDSTERLAHLLHKVTPMPHLNAAIGVRASARCTASVIVDAISSGAHSCDDLSTRIVEILRATIDPIRPIWEAKFGRSVLQADVIVAGWSETIGPHAYIVATGNHHGDDMPAWTVLPIGGTFLTPTNTQLATDFSNLQLEFDDNAAVELVTRQRAIARQVSTKKMPCGVGAFVQLCTVHETGIETRILKRWPDRVGSLIAA
jgi:hypothetical protein